MKKLNLGCGINKLEGFENLDIETGWSFEAGPWPHYGTVDAITISHAIMYVPEAELKRVMYELYKCLKFYGVLRITEDDTEHPDSERREGYEGHAVKTGPKMMRRYLEQAGFEVHDVRPDQTRYTDKSLIQNFHGIPPKVFHMEAIKTMTFKDLELAHKYLDNLHGIEIGASAHNPFNLPHCLNVDYTDDMNTAFKKAEVVNCGKAAPVDVVSNGDTLPFEDSSQDYLVNSHVLEHFFDPIKTLEEWRRVVKPGGYILSIVPHELRVPDESRPADTLQNLIDRHEGKFKPEQVNWEGAHGGKSEHGHWTVWNLELFIALANYMKFEIVATEDPDQKVGNGLTMLMRVIK
jgi:predicted SAM-dependent methyltransferase